MEFALYERMMKMSIEVDIKTKGIDDYTVWNTKHSFSELSNTIKDRFVEDVPIVSVGSGNGKFESFHIQNTGKNIICVDPDPTASYKNKKIYIKPKYPTVKELISDLPYIVKNCNLLLIWGLPGDDYDMEAIEKLKPLKIIVLFEDGGSAGSSRFHDNKENLCDGEYIFNPKEDMVYEYKINNLLGTDYYILRTYTRIMSYNGIYFLKKILY